MECTMRLTGLAAVGVALAMASTGMARGAEPGALEVGMTVTVAADGSVAAVVPDASLPEPIRAGLVRRVSTWRYEIPQWQGHPVALQTRLGLRLQTVPTATGGFALRIMGGTAAPDPDGHPGMVPPAYPVQAMRQKVSAQFVYLVHMTPDGTLHDVRLLSSSKPPKGLVGQLDQAAREAIVKWKMGPVRVDGNAIACDRAIPITFSLSDVPPPRAEYSGDAGPQACPKAKLETKIDGMLL